MTLRVRLSFAAAQEAVWMKCADCVTILSREQILVLNFFLFSAGKELN